MTSGTYWPIIDPVVRFVSLGNPTRALATQEPEMTSILPIDDTIWNEGV